MNRENLEELISRHLDGLDTEQEAGELSALIENDPGVRELYLRFARIHAALAAEAEPRPSAAGMPPPLHRTATRVRYFALAAGFAAIGLFVSAGWNWFRSLRPEPEAPVVAHFGELTEVRWVSAGKRVASGEGIRAGSRLELSSGAAEIKFASGAVTTLLGPGLFDVNGPNEGFLALGHVRVRADTPESKGFTIDTRTARIIDIGTEFVASVAPDGQSRVDVTAGEVDVLVQGMEAPHRLKLGQAMSVEAGPAQVIVWIESGDGTAAFRFPTIEPPSDLDYADLAQGYASIAVVKGNLHHTAPIPSGDAWLLLNRRGQSAPDSPAESVFFDNDASGLLLLDLGRAIDVHRINTYSWHETKDGTNRVRAVQKYNLYGYDGDVPPGFEGRLSANGWQLLARVDSDAFFDVMDPLDRPAQQASSITGATGALGRYRYLLWEVHPTHGPRKRFLNNTFYAEFDVYGVP